MDDFENSQATMIFTDEPDNGSVYMATGLELPTSSYLFRVAAVNNLGIGPFATIQTKKGQFVVCAIVVMIGVITY